MSRLYWIGLYDERDSKKREWFFQVDLAPAIAKRIVEKGKLGRSHDVAGSAGIDAKERSKSLVAAILV